MFYKMITNARNRWLMSDQCTVKDLFAYIETAGQMRDAQIDAIKTYLFLKIACDCQPLADLFRLGKFNTLELDEVPLKTSTKDFLMERPSAAALFEYARLRNDAGEQVSIQIEEQIKNDPESIN